MDHSIPRTPERPRYRPSRPLLPLLVAAVLLASTSVAHAAAEGLGAHVRIQDQRLKALVEIGITRSETFRTLVAALDNTPILVYVSCDPLIPSRLAARLSFVTSVASVRYVRIDMSCAIPERRQIPLLAHEFQHALEIGLSPDIIDTDSMEEHYQSIGFQTYSDGTHKGFETDAALAIERRVKDEVYGKGNATR